VAGACECGEEPSGSIKQAYFIHLVTSIRICFGLYLLLRICGFHGNRSRDDRTFRMDVDEVIFMRVPQNRMPF
jgi:hypothetical protein